MPQLVRSQLVALQQLLPGKCSRLPRQNVIQGLIRKRERPSELIEFDPASPDSIAHKTERLHHAAKAGIACKRCHEVLRLRQSLGLFPDLGARTELPPAALHKLTDVRLSTP